MQIPSFLTHVPVDWIILFIFALIVMFDALRYGSARASALAISMPLSVFLFDMLPRTAFVGSFIQEYASGRFGSIVFVVFLVIIFFLVYRMTYYFGNKGGFISALFSALAGTAAAIVMWLQEPLLQSIWHFGGQVQTVFGAPYALLWLLAAYIALAFARG